MKQTQEHHWSSVVRGDERGTYELVGEDAERVKEIHNRLEHLTSDKPVSLFVATFNVKKANCCIVTKPCGLSHSIPCSSDHG